MSKNVELSINDIIEDSDDDDVTSYTHHQSSVPLGSTEGGSESLTLESILNEQDDDDEADDVITTGSGSGRAGAFGGGTASFISSSTSETLTGSMSTSIGVTAKNGIVCKSLCLKQIAAQMSAHAQSGIAGLPLVLTISSNYIAIGTTYAFVYIFDTLQVLKTFIKLHDDGQQNQISALSFNNDNTRILVGDINGIIYQYDTESGKQMRKITRDVHQIDTSIIHLKYTDLNNLAVFSDSSGSVFALDFKRTMGIRTYESKCIFSGSRGEVCCLEPLKFHEKFYENLNEKQNLQNSIKKLNLNSLKQIYHVNVLLAMASFTKLFIIKLKPELNVLYTCQLPGSSIYLPILSWQFVIINYNTTKRSICPILAYSRESTIQYLNVDHQSDATQSVHTPSSPHQPDFEFKFVQIQKSTYNYKIINFCWLNAKTIAVLDTNEILHIIDVRTNDELQTISLKIDNISLVYQSTLFKCTSTGGYVSQAFAQAGENACYHSFVSYLGQLFILGTNTINLYALQNWSTRIDDYVNDKRLDLAIDLCIAMYNNRVKALVGLPLDIKQRRLKIADKLIDLLYLYINRHLTLINILNQNDLDEFILKCINTCIEINRVDLLFGNVYELIYTSSNEHKNIDITFYKQLIEPILNRKLATSSVPPIFIKTFINCSITCQWDMDVLERCILSFNVYDLDIDELMKLSKRHHMFDVLIYILNDALCDFKSPFVYMLKDELVPCKSFMVYDTALAYLNEKFLIKSFNKLLVYLNCCLNCISYNDSQPLVNGNDIRDDVFSYLTQVSNTDLTPLLDGYDYPLLRVYLNFNILDFLNILTVLFQDEEFSFNKKLEFIHILINKFLLRNFFNIKQLGYVYLFLARQFINNTITIDYLTHFENLFAQIIEFLCSNGNGNDTSFYIEYEQTLFNIINKFNDNGKIQELNEYIDINYLINLLYKAKYYSICEYIYELKGEFHLIIDCYLNQSNLNVQIYDVIDSIINRLYETNRTQSSLNVQAQVQHQQQQLRSHKNSFLIKNRDIQLSNLIKKLLNYTNLKLLCDIDAKQCGFLLWIKLNIDLKSILFSFDVSESSQNGHQSDGYTIRSVNSSSSLISLSGADHVAGNDDDRRRCKYRFLSGLFELIEEIKSKQEFMHYLTNFTSYPKYLEIYIELMCMYEPGRLIGFLKTCDYELQLDECIRICKEYNVLDSYAFLLEKNLQIDLAFRVYLEQINLNATFDYEHNERIVNRIIELFENSSHLLSYKQKEMLWFEFYDHVIRFIDLSEATGFKEFLKKESTKILNSMVAQNLNINSIINKMLTNSHLYSSEIKQFLIKMIDMYTYERTLLQTTCKIFNKDLYQCLNSFKHLKDKPFSSLIYTSKCNQCRKDLADDIFIFHCGHIYHKDCLNFHACPLCDKNTQTPKSNLTNNDSLIRNSTDELNNGLSGGTAGNNGCSLSQIQIDILKYVNYKNKNENSLKTIDGGQLRLAPSNISKFLRN